MNEYVKLRDLVDSSFSVQSVKGYQFKMWSPSENKMLVSDTPIKGYRKLWQVVTDKGQLDLGSGQMGTLLEGLMHAGKSDIIGATFEVKSNGKSGIDIRYYFNPVKLSKAEVEQDLDKQTLEELGF